ncbi:MAG: glycosyltransferase, partial [Thermodesulfobacteriota bacterium]
AGKPVVAVDASGVREVVRDGENGWLLAVEDIDDFAGALSRVLLSDPEQRRSLVQGARHTAERFSITNTAEKALRIYGKLIEKEYEEQDLEDTLWSEARNRLETEWQLVRKLIDAGIDTIKEKSGLNGRR